LLFATHTIKTCPLIFEASGKVAFMVGYESLKA